MDANSCLSDSAEWGLPMTHSCATHYVLHTAQRAWKKGMLTCSVPHTGW